MSGTITTMQPFKLERYFDKYEHSVRHHLCASDSEPWLVSDVLKLASDEDREAYLNLRLAYTHTRGHPELLQAIATLYNDLKTALSLPASAPTIADGDSVVLVPEEGIYLAMSIICRPGDHVVVTFPGYQSLWEVAKSKGCSVDYWEPQQQPDGTLAFQTDTLKSLLKPNTRMVVVNFPHNPTGLVLQQQQWQELVDLCRGIDAYLFSDEMYLFLPHDPAAQQPSAVHLYPEKAVALCGMSKCWGMPGIRIGWLTTKDHQLLDQVSTLKDYTTICSSGPSELLALIGLRASKQIVEQQRKMIVENLALLDAFFARYSELFSWQRPTHGTIAFAALKTGQDTEQFCADLVEKCGVLLLPATVYEHQPSVQQGRFRIGFGRKDVGTCLEAFEEYLRTAGSQRQ